MNNSDDTAFESADELDVANAEISNPAQLATAPRPAKKPARGRPPKSAKVAEAAAQATPAAKPKSGRARKVAKETVDNVAIEVSAAAIMAEPAASTEAPTGAVVPDPQAPDEKMRILLDWLEARGANLPSLRIASGDGIRGICARKPIVDGELVMHIPLSAMITLDVCKASTTGKLIATHGANVSDYGYMAAFLIEVRREGGFWKAYVDVMPQDFPDHPLFFSPSELAYLKGSYTLPMIEEQQNWLAYEYKQVLSCLPKGHAFSSRDFAWARCIVMTRTYTVTIQNEQSLAMVPLADMLNHSNEADVIWTGESTYGFSLFAGKNIEAGNHVYESYGRRCNGRLFVHHGFCLDENEDNEAEIDMPSLLPAHPFYAYTKELGTVRDDVRVFKVSQQTGSESSRALFSMLRLGCLEDLPGVYRTMVNGAKTNDVPPVSRKNEVAALTALASACQRGLKRFDGTLEEDDALLAGDTLPRKLRYAVMVRRGEKAILKHYLELAHTAIPVLQNPFCDLQDYAVTGQRFTDYFGELSSHLNRSMDE